MIALISFISSVLYIVGLKSLGFTFTGYARTLGGGGGGGGKEAPSPPPMPPPPAPPPPTEDTEVVRQNAEAERRRAAAAKGYSSTDITNGTMVGGISTDVNQKPTLLGGS